MSVKHGLGRLVLCLLLWSGSSAFAAEDPRQAVDAILAKFESSDAPALSVGVYREGQVVYSRAFGLENLEYRQKATTATMSNVASVSKQFTAFAIALLERDGKIDIKADIRTYLPELPVLPVPVTVYDLVHHLSGMRDANILLNLAQRDPSERLRLSHVLRMIERQHTTRYEPGTKFSYTNTGYLLLAEIVRRASGQTLRQFTAERIFKPLGMSQTYFRDDASEIVPPIAPCYTPRPGGGWRRCVYNVEYVGATGLATSIDDLLKWIANFERPVVGDAELIKRITAASTLRNGEVVNYGYGLWRQRYAGREAITHDGSIAGHRALMVWLPKERFGLVMIATMPIDLGVPATQIIEAYLGKAKPPKDSALHKEDAKPIVADAALLASLAGRFLPSETWAADLVAEDGKLFWVTAPLPKMEVTLREHDIFTRGIGDSQRWFRFLRDKKGHVEGFQALPDLGDARAGERFTRAPFYTLTGEGLREFEGDFRVPDLDVTYTLQVRDGRLTARSLWSVADIKLVPVAPDRFDTDAIGLGGLMARRDAAGRLTGFRIVGGGNVGLELDRIGPSAP